MDTSRHCSDNDTIKRKSRIIEMISPENILAHELIGMNIEIITKDNHGFYNLHGRILFESKNMILLQTIFGIKKIPKEMIKKARLLISGRDCFINGFSLLQRPEDRVSRIFELKKNG